MHLLYFLLFAVKVLHIHEFLMRYYIMCRAGFHFRQAQAQEKAANNKER